MNRKQLEKLSVTVCAECLCASCWQGMFMCEKARMAGPTQRTGSQLAKLGREHSDWWKESLEQPGESVAAFAIARR